MSTSSLLEPSKSSFVEMIGAPKLSDKQRQTQFLKGYQKLDANVEKHLAVLRQTPLADATDLLDLREKAKKLAAEA